MKRSRRSRRDQPLPVRWLLRLYRGCASLRLAVVVIAVYAVVLAWATVLESSYGHQSNAAHDGIYKTPWFLVLNALLGLNVLCAVLVRFPWSRYLAGLLRPFPGWLILGSLVVIPCLYGSVLLVRHAGSYAGWRVLSLLGTWWVVALEILVGLNVLYALAVHIWWKRQQTGFVITHAGILILLYGCWLTSRGGIDASLPIFEGGAAWRAIQDSQSLKLAVYPNSAENAAGDARDPDASGGSGPASKPETIRIPFVAGPFNWDDYDQKFWFPWGLARRDRGVVYAQGGIRLEVRDYYSDSREIPIPRLRLRVSTDSSAGRSLSGEAGETIELAIEAARGPHGAGRPFGVGSRRRLPGGQRIVFLMTGSPAETRAFRDSRPEGSLGPPGQIVLHAAGRKFQVPVAELQKRPRRPLGESGLDVELVELFPQLPGVQLRIHQGDEPPQRMFLLADAIELSQQDYHHGVFGSYWVHPEEPAEDAGLHPQTLKMLRNARLPRIDVLQGADRKLYYRTWHAATVDAIGRLPDDGSEVVAFAGSDHAVIASVEEFTGADRPAMELQAVAFDRDLSPARKQRQARLKLTVDGNAREFWLAATPPGVPDSARLPETQRRVVEGKNRRVAIRLANDEIDLGFQIFLHRFNRKLDPGTNKVSHYSSLVDFVDRHDGDRRLQENVLITLNAPVNFSDAGSGRSYRLYQSSYSGPYRPGDPQFRQVVGGSRRRERLFQSVLAVNYDPGRGAKYVGSLMICAGILITFSMKSRFLRARNGRTDRSGEAN